MNKPTLYVIATPIGNMADMTKRAIDTLSAVDIIYAEDTRQTAKLLQYFAIQKPLYALHKHNEKSELVSMLNHINSNKNIAIVSDAGTPLIADPGYVVIEFMREHDVHIETIPGCCSVIAALSISGLAADQFCFAGFIPTKSNQRRDFLAQYIDTNITTVFFETPHRILASLADFASVFDAQRKIFIGRELTKKFEDTALMTIEQAQIWIKADENRVRGEFVLALEKNPSQTKKYDWMLMANSMLDNEVATKTIAKIVAELTGESKKVIYNYCLEKQKND